MMSVVLSFALGEIQYLNSPASSWLCFVPEDHTVWRCTQNCLTAIRSLRFVILTIRTCVMSDFHSLKKIWCLYFDKNSKKPKVLQIIDEMRCESECVIIYELTTQSVNMCKSVTRVYTEAREPYYWHDDALRSLLFGGDGLLSI